MGTEKSSDLFKNQFVEGSAFLLGELGSGQTLTTVPNGNLDVETCFVQGSPKCFIASSGSVCVKPKVLLLTVDTNCLEKNYSPHFVLERLAALQSQGFNIYVVCGNNFILLPDLANLKENTFLIEKSLGIPFSEFSAIPEMLAKELKISVDSILLLTKEILERYVSGDETDFSWLLTTTSFKETGVVSLSGSGITFTKLLIFLQRYSHQLVGLDIRDCQGLYEGPVDDVLSFPKLTFPHLTKLFLCPDYSNSTYKTPAESRFARFIYHLLQSINGTLEEFECHDPGISSDLIISYTNVKNLRALVFCGRLCDKINQLLKQASSLECLVLSSIYSYAHCSMLLQDSQFSFLKKLKLENVSLPEGQPGALLQSARSLEELCLINISCSDQALWAGLALASLRQLKLKNVSLLKEQLGALLQSACALEELDLSNISFSDEALCDRLALASLRKLSLNHISLSEGQMGALLQSACALQELYLIKVALSGNVLFPEGLSFAVLKHFNFQGSHLMTRQLSTLLQKMPRLEKMDIRLALLSGDGFLLDDLKLFFLREVRIRQQACTLLQRAPNLEVLELFYCDPDFCYPIMKVVLDKLTRLNICSGYVSLNFLQGIVNQAPNLRWLCFTDVFLLGNYPALNLKLDSLYLLDLSQSNFSLSQLRVMLSQAINLKRLVLGCASGPAKDELNSIVEDSSFSPCVRSALRKALQDYYPKQVVQETACSPSSSLPVDADSSCDVQSLKAQKIFTSINGAPPVEVGSYRLYVYNRVKLREFARCSEPPFELCAPVLDEAQLVAKCVVAKTDFHSPGYRGQIDLALSSGVWVALPSLSAAETIETLTTVPPADLDLSYNPVDGFHYVRLKPDGVLPAKSYRVFFTVSLVQSPLSAVFLGDSCELPLEMLNIILRYKQFTEGKLDTTGCNNGKDYLRAIRKQKVGVCRHRVVACLEELLSLLQSDPTALASAYQVRAVANPVHVVIEVVNVSGANIRVCPIDLGGGVTEIKVLPLPKSESLLKVKKGMQYDQIWLQSGHAFFNSTAELLSTLRRDVGASGLVGSRNLLWRLPQTDIVRASIVLGRYLQEHGDRVFYIDFAEELRRSGCYLARDTQGQVRRFPGPGGALHKFLIDSLPEGKARILIVNYSNFTDAEIVACHELLDHRGPLRRHVDGIEVAVPLCVIGLCAASDSAAYLGSDFLSRFEIKHCTMRLPADMPRLDSWCEPITESYQEDAVVIDFYGSSVSWRQYLLGSLRLDRGIITFKESEFLRYLASGRPIVFMNLPKTNEFNIYMRRALEDGFFLVYGFRYVIPEMALRRWYAADGYNLGALSLSVVEHEPEGGLLLNPSAVSKWVGGHEYDFESQEMCYKEGYFASISDGTLVCCLSRDLSRADWARLNSACLGKNVRIQLYVAPGVSLPSELVQEALPKRKHPWLPFQVSSVDARSNQVVVIKSTDPDVTGVQLAILNPIHLFISEEDLSRLLVSYVPQFNKASGVCVIKSKHGPLLTWLQQGGRVVLQGDFSGEWVDQLQLLIGSKKIGCGRLYLLPTHEITLLGCVSYYKHQVTVAEKRQALDRHNLPSNSLLTDEQLQELTYVQAKAILSHGGGVDMLAPWQGMYELPPGKKITAVDLSQSKIVSSDFESNRLTRVLDKLRRNGFVFLAGISGVGKTTFVQHVLAAQPGITLFEGIEALPDFAKPTKEGECRILFIDEATIACGTDYSAVFENMFQVNRPGVLVGCEFIFFHQDHPSSNRWLVCAGNPVSYGGERKLPKFFSRHGGSEVFGVMPPGYVFEKLLRPIFVGTKLEGDAEYLLRPIIDVYIFLAEHSRDEMLISVRALEMMALMTLLGCSKADKVDRLEVVKYYVRCYSKSVVPFDLQDEYNAQFPPVKERQILPRLRGVAVTSVNQEAYSRLLDFFRLHRYRRQIDANANADNFKTLFGGLGRLVLMGEPGLGKTLLVRELVRRLMPGEVIFLPANMPLADKKATLRKAWDQGIGVVLDEANSQPALAEFFNQALMGKCGGVWASRPGFFSVEMGNAPTAFRGRREPTMSSQHRSATVVLQTPNAAELSSILHESLRDFVCMFSSGDILNREMIYGLAESYLRARDNGVHICTRDFIKLAAGEMCKHLGASTVNLLRLIELFGQENELLVDIVRSRMASIAHVALVLPFPQAGIMLGRLLRAAAMLGPDMVPARLVDVTLPRMRVVLDVLVFGRLRRESSGCYGRHYSGLGACGRVGMLGSTGIESSTRNLPGASSMDEGFYLEFNLSSGELWQRLDEFLSAKAAGDASPSGNTPSGP